MHVWGALPALRDDAMLWTLQVSATQVTLSTMEVTYSAHGTWMKEFADVATNFVNPILFARLPSEVTIAPV